MKGTARNYSDLDLCYQKDIPLVILGKIREEFAESNLPFEVELINWKHMRPAFQELIKERFSFITILYLIIARYLSSKKSNDYKSPQKLLIETTINQLK